MPTNCVIGLLWGDEGKGKIIDLFAEDADVVVRFGGGHNAGHTLIHNGERLVLHLVPSGIRHPSTVNVIGNGVVVDPYHLRDEVARLQGQGIEIELGRNLLVSESAHLILPLHTTLDHASERARGVNKLGTTGRGIGPTYADRANRAGIRVGDLVRPARLKASIARLVADKNLLLEAFGESPCDGAALERELTELGAWLRPAITDTGSYLRRAHAEGRRLLFEGAQGVLLDVDHGTYPFVTSSSSSTGGIAVGTGLPPQVVHDVTGVVKSYATRVGSGPFPTELDGDIADRLRTAGHEFGSTTGRPRRIGWFDAVAVRYAAAVSGTTGLVLTNLDVLSGFGEIGVATAYEMPDGTRTEDFPTHDLDGLQPVFEYLEGFEGDLTGIRTFDALPAAARAYVEGIESRVGVPVRTISVGPGREQVIPR